jgi:hypothetical protein
VQKAVVPGDGDGGGGGDAVDGSTVGQADLYEVEDPSRCAIGQCALESDE